MDNDHTDPVPFWRLFRFADAKARLLFFLGLLCAAAHGALFPIINAVFGSALNSFAVQPPSSTTIWPAALSDSLRSASPLYVALTLAHLLTAVLESLLCNLGAHRVSRALQKRLFAAIVRQTPAFYDTRRAEDLTHLMAVDTDLVASALGPRLAMAVQMVFMYISAVLLGLTRGWRLALVMMAATPVLLLAAFAAERFSAKAALKATRADAAAAASAAESLSLVRTVTAHSAQCEETTLYRSALERSCRAAVRAAKFAASGVGCTVLLVHGMDALAMWFGTREVRLQRMQPGDMAHVFISLAIAVNSLNIVAPAFKAFTVARCAAAVLFAVIDAETLIDPLNNGGIVPDECVGEISFDAIDFGYCVANDAATGEKETKLVLKDLNITIAPGASEALVGPSGCGKSTTASLVQRLYDPVKGAVRLDGTDLRDLNVHWLRSQIGVVSQTPCLFMLSVRENIALGAGVAATVNSKTGKAFLSARSVSEEAIIRSAKMANAHDFIMQLPDGYDTMLGERGARLSGGQKQRICIARALVRNPKVLVLDECTSSLDVKSERVVWDALEKAATGRTTITIAHRLSTVRNATNISFFKDGRVCERGPHADLMNIYDGIYREMVISNALLAKEDGGKACTSSSWSEPSMDDTNSSRSVTDDSESITGSDDSSKKPAPQAAETQRHEIRNAKMVHHPLWHSLKINSEEWPLVLAGILGAMLLGVSWHGHAFMLIRVIEVVLSDDVDEKRTTRWIVLVVCVGVVGAAGTMLQQIALGTAGERLSKRLRGLCFQSMIYQPMAFFDRKENCIGALTSLLSHDASQVKGLTSTQLGICANVFAFFFVTMATAFLGCRSVALKTLPIALAGPVLLVASNWLNTRLETTARENIAATVDSITGETVDNHATVRSLGVELLFSRRFQQAVGSSSSLRNKQFLSSSFSYGLAEFCQTMALFTAVRTAGAAVRSGDCSFIDVLQTAWTLSYFVLVLTRLSIFGPEFSTARASAKRVFDLLYRRSVTHALQKGGKQNMFPSSASMPSICANAVRFEYPSRPDVPVLKGLSLKVTGGQRIAIVGESGHGKSTVLSLLQRFYDYSAGHLRVDGHEVHNTEPDSLRNAIGVVGQEAELFDRSVYDNIAYGLQHDDGSDGSNGIALASKDAVIEAARAANAHDFITRLPDGYDTRVGRRGDRLSGGQRQRVAIARALVRQPRLLLLDEATSALDGESERFVQGALHVAVKGRTTIVVAHRLSTVRGADNIFVVRHGRIVESGRHDELVLRNGAYSQLVASQLA